MHPLFSAILDDPNERFVLISGGVRSGKTSFLQALLQQHLNSANPQSDFYKLQALLNDRRTCLIIGENHSPLTKFKNLSGCYFLTTTNDCELCLTALKAMVAHTGHPPRYLIFDDFQLPPTTAIASRALDLQKFFILLQKLYPKTTIVFTYRSYTQIDPINGATLKTSPTWGTPLPTLILQLTEQTIEVKKSRFNNQYQQAFPKEEIICLNQ